MGVLRFVITNDPTLDFDLIQEAWIDDQLVADISQTDGVWHVRFFPQEKYCELDWYSLSEIHQTFFTFTQGQTM